MTVFCSVTIQMYATTSQAEHSILDNQTLFSQDMLTQSSQNKLFFKNMFIILKQSLKPATKCTVLMAFVYHFIDMIYTYI